MSGMLRGVAQFQEQVDEDYRELPCRDFDFDCYGFDGLIPFGDYKKCQEYMPEMGKCIFLTNNTDPDDN